MLLSLSPLEQEVLDSTGVQSALKTLAGMRSRRENAQLYEAVRAGLLSEALQHLKKMEAGQSPSALAVSKLRAFRTIQLSFAGLEVTGYHTAKKKLDEGSTVTISTHFTYFDLAVIAWLGLNLFDIIAPGKSGRHNYVIGGDNVATSPEGKLTPVQLLKSKLVKWYIPNSGLIQIKRDITKDDLLEARVAVSLVDSYLRNGDNIELMAGSGRYKRGELQPLDTIFSRTFLSSAKFVIPVARTFTIVPEDYRFAAGTDQQNAPLYTIDKDQRWDRRYGKIYVNFGRPIRIPEYPPGEVVSSKERAKFEANVNEALLKLIAITHVNLFAALATEGLQGDYSQEISIQELSVRAFHTLMAAKQSGMHVSKQLASLPSYNLEAAMAKAAKALVWRKGLLPSPDGRSYRIGEPKLLEYYARHITPTLAAYNIRL